MQPVANNTPKTNTTPTLNEKKPPQKNAQVDQKVSHVRAKVEQGCPACGLG